MELTGIFYAVYNDDDIWDLKSARRIKRMGSFEFPMD